MASEPIAKEEPSPAGETSSAEPTASTEPSPAKEPISEVNIEINISVPVNSTKLMKIVSSVE